MKSDGRDRWLFWKLALVFEAVALAIGLIMPISPSKTGSDFSLADWFFDDPTYLQEVVVYFIFTNLLLGVLVLIFLAISHREKRRDSSSKGKP